MRYFSMFSGIGGFEQAIYKIYESHNRRFLQIKTSEGFFKQLPSTSSEQIRATCVGYSEIDKYAIQVYESHFPTHKNYGNATTINADELPDFDLLVGGFPCQAFSIAGKRRGFEDTRGTLFFDIARILRAKKPKNFVLENVKGLLSHDNGNTFKTIITTLAELGYCVEWQVLNSKNYGVPQNRERVFIIGHFGGLPCRQVFPIRENDQLPHREIESREGRAQTQLSGTLRGSNVKADGTFIKENLSIQKIKKLNNPIHSNNRVYGIEGISPTLNTAQGGNRQPKIVKVSGDLDKRRVYLGDIASTLAANPTSDNSARLFEDKKIRRLTPTECERLQGFPDGWTLGLSDSQRYKTLGNAVTVNTVQAVIESLTFYP